MEEHEREKEKKLSIIQQGTYRVYLPFAIMKYENVETLELGKGQSLEGLGVGE